MKTREGLVSLLVILLALPVITYCSAYAWARASHRLVFHTNGSVTGPHASHGIGIGFTTWELVFAPLALLEGSLRGAR